MPASASTCPTCSARPESRCRSPYMAGQMARACIAREFSVLARNESSPITEWLRALCRHAHEECGGPGVGAIGMCLTGKLRPGPDGGQGSHGAGAVPALAAVSQSRRRTAGPCICPRTTWTRSASGSPAVAPSWACASAPIPWCPPSASSACAASWGRDSRRSRSTPRRAIPHGISRTAHSVVTQDLVDAEGHPTRAAFERVLAFFAERLKATPRSSARFSWIYPSRRCAWSVSSEIRHTVRGSWQERSRAAQRTDLPPGWPRSA